ncbi:O-methyltransferase [Niabella ginsengisoli]|uniref:Class I SAM-dependent methyltransferase n=1 Tax=Niabella ginsengisoli TaxID=522298 RepID=A0ABS9SJH5_9BACT|nr:class I SAM-dependent methyltransferase [Niabella ginsengisoli]MCH5598461.1 class I SAM-dependent methyltransferase [Niabella ginsengisoli]
MQDKFFNNIPKQYDLILDATKALAFNMASDLQTGSLLSTLAASKSNANILEMGTGSGLSTSWILSGMDNKSRLTTIENNELLLDIAKKNLVDERVDFVLADGYEWLKNYSGEKFDLLFADAMPGKYDLFEEAFDLLKPGGIYFIDDMLPQPNWPEGHAERVDAFINMLDHKTDVTFTKLSWSTGIIIVVKNI